MKMKKVSGVRRCRLCACEDNFTDFTNIFDDNPELELEMKIMKLLPIIVMPWDPMPHVVCHKCISLLNSYNDFYEASLKTEKFLRTLYTSTPEKEPKTLDSVVEVIDTPVLKKTSIKLPRKKRQAISTLRKNRKDSANSSEFILKPHQIDEDQSRTSDCFTAEKVTNKESIPSCQKCLKTFTRQNRKDSANSSELNLKPHQVDEDQSRTLDCFTAEKVTNKESVPSCQKCLKTFTRQNRKDSANSSELNLEPHQVDEDQSRTSDCFTAEQVTNKESIPSCQKCLKTFTRQSSVLMHPCVRVEDGGEVEKVSVKNHKKRASGKALPPLKIRLFSVRSGIFVCHLCRSRFEEKTNVVEHIKEHFVNKQWEGRGVKKYKQREKRKGRQTEIRKNDDREETYKKNAVRRKRKKSSEPSRKRAKTRNVGVSEECLNESCAKSGLGHNSPDIISPAKETMEQMPQYSEVLEVSDEEIQVKDDEPSSVLIQAVKEPVKRTENFVETPAEPEHAGDSSLLEKSIDLENSENADDPVEIRQTPEVDSKTDEITVLEVINNKTPSSFSSCIFCDKIFSTKDALIAHQNRHLQGYPGYKLETLTKKSTEPAAVFVENEENYLCSICAMMFTSQETLFEHEQCHFVDLEGTAGQRKIRIALGHESNERDAEQERQISKGRGFVTITVTAGEKNVPQIEFIRSNTRTLDVPSVP